MSKLSNGFLGVLAAALTLGAVQLEVASGNDLFASPGLDARVRDGVLHGINREGKRDRLAGQVRVSDEKAVISFAVPARDMLIVTRIAAPPSAKPAQPAASSTKSPGSAAGSKVACELAVSSLVSVAKRLSPGRCMA